LSWQMFPQPTMASRTVSRVVAMSASLSVHGRR
jgi:hypothetical protein